MATFSNIGLAEPSTITKVVASVTIARGSTTEHQEILVIGGPNSSLAVAPVLAAAPASTEFGLAVRIVSGPSSAADLPVNISGNSTVMQGTSPWTIAGNSTVIQGTSPWVISGNSTVVVASVLGSAGKLNIGSTAADNAVSISGNSTVIQGTSPWVISGNSTVMQGTNPWVVSPTSTSFAINSGFHFDTSGSLLTAGGAGGSSQVTISQVLDSSGGGVVFGDSANNALRVNVVAGAAGGSTVVSVNQITSPWIIGGNSTVFQGSSAWQVQVSNGNSSVIVTSGNSSVIITSGNSSVTVSAWAATTGKLNIGSTAADNVITIGAVSGGRMNIGSTAADNAVVVSGNSTVAPLAGSLWTVAGASTSPPSSGSAALYVRPVIPTLLTLCSSNAFASTLLAVNSTIAGERCRVFAYSVTSTVQAPTKVSFYGGSSLKWQFVLAALSSAVTGVNLAVTPPAYLFQCAAGSSMTLRTPSSLAGFKVSVGYWMGV